MFHGLFAGNIWQPATTGAFAGILLPNPLVGDAFCAEGRSTRPHDAKTTTLKISEQPRRTALGLAFAEDASGFHHFECGAGDVLELIEIVVVPAL